MEQGFTVGFKEGIIIVMAIFNLVLWGPIGWNVRRLVNDYDKHKQSNRESLQQVHSNINEGMTSLRSDLEELEKRYNDLRAELPEKYVSVRRFEEQMKAIETLFQRIMDKLENKADKK